MAKTLLVLGDSLVRFCRLPSVLMVVAGVSGGLFLTVLSGLYVVKPLVMDAEIVYFGFPFAWFEAARKGLLIIGPWVYRFIWQNFVADFMIYGLLVSGVIYLYFATRARASKVENVASTRVVGWFKVGISIFVAGGVLQLVLAVIALVGIESPTSHRWATVSILAWLLLITGSLIIYSVRAGQRETHSV